jgi:hypothetical protein
VLSFLCDGGIGGVFDDDRGGSLKGMRGGGWTVGGWFLRPSVGGVFLPGVSAWLRGGGGAFECWCGAERALGDRDSGEGVLRGGVTSAAALKVGGRNGVVGVEGRRRRRVLARAVVGIVCGEVSGVDKWV